MSDYDYEEIKHQRCEYPEPECGCEEAATHRIWWESNSEMLVCKQHLDLVIKQEEQQERDDLQAQLTLHKRALDLACEDNPRCYERVKRDPPEYYRSEYRQDSPNDFLTQAREEKGGGGE